MITISGVVDLNIDDDEDLEDEEGKTDEDESKNFTTSVGNDESMVDIVCALFGCSNVSVNCNFHSDVSWNNGSDTSDQEGNSGVSLTKFMFSCEEKEDGETNQEECEEGVFLFEESDSSLYNSKLEIGIGEQSILHLRSIVRYVSF